MERNIKKINVWPRLPEPQKNHLRDIATCFSVSGLFIALLILSAAQLSNLYEWMDNPANQFTLVIFFLLACSCFGFYCAVRYIKNKF